MFSLTTWWMPQAAARRVEAERRGRAVAMARSAARAVERHPPAEEEVGVEVAEQQVGVGDGRLGAAAAVAGGPGLARRRCPARP